MFKKHFFSGTSEGGTSAIVREALQSFVTRNPSLALDEEQRVVYSKTHPISHISIISGGGSGHEPAWSGYVGDGMLAAAICGDVFASPSTKQIMAGARQVPSSAGVILCITNYTGDLLHFGLAKEQLLARGHRVGIVNLSEDAALPRAQAGLVGRRGLAGNLLVLKLIGAANERGWSFERVLQLGNLGNSQLVTIGTSLDHCHIPGRAHHEPVPDDACVLGMGIHNEPGLRTISPLPSAEDIIREMHRYLLDTSDPDRSFVKFGANDEVVMLVNNFGGLSNLELDALANIAREQLVSDWNLSPLRVYVGTFETSLNGPGFSVTVGNLTGIAKDLDLQVADVLELLDAPTSAPAWPKNGYAATTESAESAAQREKTRSEAQSGYPRDNGPASSAPVIQGLAEACRRACAAEPAITRFDIQMGDGDCGEAVDQLCKAILAILAGEITAASPIFTLLEAVGDALENVGGSLGAILSIFLTAFSSNLRQGYTTTGQVSLAAAAKAVGPALGTLKQYTAARVGDRTVMDSLIPFCETMGKTGDLFQSVEAAERGASSTKGMRARFGRATYIGDEKFESQVDLPPDPGAYAFAVFLKGLAEGSAH